MSNTDDGGLSWLALHPSFFILLTPSSSANRSALVASGKPTALWLTQKQRHSGSSKSSNSSSGSGSGNSSNSSISSNQQEPAMTPAAANRSRYT
ncbi:hypothetical protein HZH68_009107 [Vespula germanica]|uniref:Uncharacterized protein n=1 Tax=Vespula germanica TaxID=30212 RepID=A0A834K165_VESGE|nr:hypothetical protein HZH68_009107 [Vespula germanica]